ncbi:MAG TPA: lipid-A-disaccharide synthase N-terminal domain-containing protein [Clostridiales bacterium]|nr:lipid-A-disaccharide synthase N-terminal domain-containing protein [Clostridiales bacterium]
MDINPVFKSFTFVIGFTAQFLFSVRLFVQWIQSEKAKKVLTPELFWELSLFASFLFFIYGWMRNDFAIMFGQSITYFIYIRNMQLQNNWNNINILIRRILILLPFLILSFLLYNGRIGSDNLLKNNNIPLSLVIWGSFGQLLFSFRFVYQWIYSERIKESCLPLNFWIISLTGSAIILSYAILRIDPVLFIGQIFGFIMYLRNIIISLKEKLEK